jgi:hypothetical protein
VDSSAYARIATELNSTPGAIKVAVHRLRKRLRTAIRNEVRATVNSEEVVDDELQYLLDVVAEVP